MKINKSPQQKETNPFRPRKHVRSYTVCKVVRNTTMGHFDEYKIHVDADHKDEFKKYMETLDEAYYDSIHELWFVSDKHLTPILNVAKTIFDHIHYQDEDGKLHTYKC